ncbi:MAG: sigma-70 family RNA polymerase sigma factor [Bacteroidia bacterium]|nr:sigma-70 family RNA polymerase sigma factor [Bacteroidia bacterium]
MKTGPQDDEAIVRVQRGDRNAYAVIVQTYMKPAYYSALSLVGSHDDAMELSQQAFVRAYTSIASFQLGSRFFTWYYRILRNLCLNFLRDRAAHARPLSQCEALFENLAGSDDPSEDAERALLRDRVRDALGRLRPEEREILLLREFEGYNYAEISELLECPVGTVMSRLYYARKHVKEMLEDLS